MNCQGRDKSGGQMTDSAFALWWLLRECDLADRVVLCVFLNCNCNCKDIARDGQRPQHVSLAWGPELQLALALEPLTVTITGSAALIVATGYMPCAPRCVCHVPRYATMRHDAPRWGTMCTLGRYYDTYDTERYATMTYDERHTPRLHVYNPVASDVHQLHCVTCD